MNSYIIHYTKLKDRKNSILSFLSKTNYKYEFITQYDKEEIDCNEYYKPNKRIYNKKVKPLWDEKQISLGFYFRGNFLRNKTYPCNRKDC